MKRLENFFCFLFFFKLSKVVAKLFFVVDETRCLHAYV